MSTFPQLQQPPINEVVCGFILEPTPLTSLDVGVYWEQRKEDYPRHELHPRIFDNFKIELGVPLDNRVWLVGGGEEVLLQIQNDRFYMNWRRRAGEYPRFSEHADVPGLKARAISEFERFADFARSRTGNPLRLVQIELTKIDLLQKDVHYSGAAELGELVPLTKVFDSIGVAEPQNLLLRTSEVTETATTHIAIAMDASQVRIETRHLRRYDGDLGELFDASNDHVNRVFFGLVNTKRFEQKG